MPVTRSDVLGLGQALPPGVSHPPAWRHPGSPGCAPLAALALFGTAAGERQPAATAFAAAHVLHGRDQGSKLHSRPGCDGTSPRRVGLSDAPPRRGTPARQPARTPLYRCERLLGFLASCRLWQIEIKAIKKNFLFKDSPLPLLFNILC